MVIVDPYPTVPAAMPDGRGRRIPAAGRDPVGDRGLGDRVEPQHPVARERDRASVRVQADHKIMYAFAKKLGFAAGARARTSRSSRTRPAWDEPLTEDITAEITAQLDHRLHGCRPSA